MSDPAPAATAGADLLPQLLLFPLPHSGTSMCFWPIPVHPGREGCRAGSLRTSAWSSWAPGGFPAERCWSARLPSQTVAAGHPTDSPFEGLSLDYSFKTRGMWSPHPCRTARESSSQCASCWLPREAGAAEGSGGPGHCIRHWGKSSACWKTWLCSLGTLDHRLLVRNQLACCQGWE